MTLDKAAAFMSAAISGQWESAMIIAQYMYELEDEESMKDFFINIVGLIYGAALEAPEKASSDAFRMAKIAIEEKAKKN